MRTSILHTCFGAAIAAVAAVAAVTTFASPAAGQAPSPIRDNSFLIEEAYNQEPGVVQHILLFSRDRATHEWELGFTQEWPVISQNHQLSYSVPVVRTADGEGVGDVAVNYRYRWLARPHSESVIRISALLPTGNAARGRGAGGAGVELNFPLSVELTPAVAMHWNAGGSVIPSARALDGSRAPIREAFAGTSLVWLPHPALNLLVESVWSRAEALEPDGTRSAETSLTLVPAVRGALNLESGAQVVPGIGMMVETNGRVRVSGLLLYLSFEHGFGSR